MDVVLFTEEWMTCAPEPILVHMLRKAKPLEFCSQLAGVTIAESLLSQGLFEFTLVFETTS